VTEQVTPDTPPCPVTTGEIADLLAWCRRVAQAHPANADHADPAAYRRAKTDLLTRLAVAEGTRRD
jgi:hypothetical protein